MCRRLKQYLVGIYNTQHIDLYFVTFAIFSFAVHISFLNHLVGIPGASLYLYMTASVAVLRNISVQYRAGVQCYHCELLSAHFPPVTTELPITDKLSVVQTAMNGCFSAYLWFQQKQRRNCQRRSLFKDTVKFHHVELIVAANACWQVMQAREVRPATVAAAPVWPGRDVGSAASAPQTAVFCCSRCPAALQPLSPASL